jgi:hypothetical protein
MSETYTDRHVEWQTVKNIEHGAITGSSGWTACASDDVVARLSVGAEYGVETKGGPFGRICGWNIGGEWITRKSDQQMDREHAEFLDNVKRDRRKQLDKHRAEWIGRTENLPGWLQDRIQTFRERGRETFELEGWGYELAVCELAALYAESGGEDSDAVNAYASEHGTSGNQHDVAKALARMHGDGQNLAGTVSALSPLTGDAFYGGEQP